VAPFCRALQTVYVRYAQASLIFRFFAISKTALQLMGLMRVRQTYSATASVLVAHWSALQRQLGRGRERKGAVRSSCMPGLRPPLLFNQLKAFSRPSFFPAPGNDVVSQVALILPFPVRLKNSQDHQK